VLAVLTVGYSLNIADRFSISTLIEPIREELHLSDSGIAFLTGGALAVFYVTVGIPIADGFWAAWHLWTSGATIREDVARAS